MTSNSQDDSASPKQSRLPFEPNKSTKNSPSVTRRSSSSKRPASASEKAGIPKIVSQRMARRMALFCGAPTILGLLTFPSSYLIVTHGWLNLPNVVVLLMSMGLFGLGIVGLSYGVLSASWEEDQPGSRLGWQEFRINFSRLIQEWRGSKQK